MLLWLARGTGADPTRWQPMRYFTSDTHFGDHRTINIHKRPFAGVAEMDAALVAGWNATVEPHDEIWHLGDFARRASDVPALLARLHGVKHLVRGNNDPAPTLTGPKHSDRKSRAHG